VCNSVQLRSTVLSLVALLGVSFCKSKVSSVETRPTGVFTSAASTLDRVAATEENGIPDAVLNRTRCVVVLPDNSDLGAMSCFESLNRWTRPDLVTFKGRRTLAGTLLVFVIGAAEAKRLRTGQLEIGDKHSSSAGPLVRSKAVITDADLNFGSLLYERAHDVLSGSQARGTIALVAPLRPPGITSPTDQQLQRSLASFFNVITPMGIIIHHTAVLPGSGEIPTNRNEVDAYHAAKGFDVMCFGREYHVAYHYLILANGQVQVGRPDRCQGAHARGYNAYIGISVAGDFSSKDNPNGKRGPVFPTSKQQQALVEVCRRLRTRYKIPIHRIMRHSDVAATECPGDRFPFVRVLKAVGR
jgi:lipid-binding SYLF domain-containing protein